MLDDEATCQEWPERLPPPINKREEEAAGGRS